MPYTDAFALLAKFYTDKEAPTASQSYKSGKSRAQRQTTNISKTPLGELMATVANFPKQVVVALAHAVKYLAAFDVADALLETQFFKRFTERTHMLLNGNTLTNL